MTLCMPLLLKARDGNHRTCFTDEMRMTIICDLSCSSKALSQMEHFMCTCGLTDLQWPPRARVRLVHETVGCPIPNFSVQMGARERPFAAVMCPLSALLPSPHFRDEMPL